MNDIVVKMRWFDKMVAKISAHSKNVRKSTLRFNFSFEKHYS